MVEEGAARATSVRHYGMDWLRIGAFMLLILYHVGLAFGPWSFEIKASPPHDWIALPLLFLNAWRLPLLFLVSGFASSALVRRSPNAGAFSRERLSRLGIPLLFAMAVLNTPQPWVALVTQHGYSQDFGTFLANDYFRFQEIDGVAMPTWMHLWFVVYLLVYSLILAAGLHLLKGKGPRLLGLVERALSGWRLLALPIAYIFLVRAFLPPGWTDTHGLFDDFSAHAAYFPVFLFGFALQRSDKLLAGIDGQWAFALALALIAYAAIALAEINWPGNTPFPDEVVMPFRFARSVQCWAMVIALVGIANRFLNRDHPYWRPLLAEAVFPFYIIHQTIILLVGYWLLPTETSAIQRFVILVAATAVGSVLFYVVGRNIGWLRPLIGLRRIPKAQPLVATKVPV